MNSLFFHFLPLISRALLLAWMVYALQVDAAFADEKEPDSAAFGSTVNTGAAMIGIFYDLKQNQKHEPLDVDYMQTLGEFVDSNWDETVLSRFFRVTRPVYATEVFIPNMGAGAGPMAFKVENVVQPMRWFVVYKAQVSPPEDGTYRFVGVADDILAVAVNGKTELVAPFGTWMNYSRWREPEPDRPNIQTAEGKLRHGDWFTCRKDQIIDLDVIIGEYPGNAFGAWLLIEKKGVDYPVVQDPKYGKQYIYPVFQLRQHDISHQYQPIPFTTDSPPWTCYQ